MDWKLLTWEPNTNHANQTQANAKAVYNKASPGGLLDGFQWENARSGDCISLTFTGSPSDRNGASRLDIAIWDVVRLEIDPDDTGSFTKAFTGVITELPQAQETRQAAYTALGMRELFKLRTVDNRRINTRQDVATFVDDLSDLFPDRVAYSTPSATGFELSKFEAPGIRISEALDALVQSVTGFDWGVDGSGTFFFRETTGSLSVAYAQSGLNRLPINGREMTTKVNLFVLNGQANRALEEGDNYSLWSNGGFTTHSRRSPPVVHSFEDPAHAIYGAERNFVLNNPLGFLKPGFGIQTYQVVTANINNGSNVIDEDDATFAEWNGAGTTATVEVETPDNGTDRWRANVGMRVLFKCDTGHTVTCRLVRTKALPSWGEGATIVVATEPGTYDLTILVPADENLRDVDIRKDFVEIKATGITAGDTFRVFSVEPLFPDPDALDRFAGSLISVPASTPLEVAISGYSAPVGNVTVTDAPGGDATGDAVQFQYAMTGTAGVRTLVDVGQRAEGDDARAIRLESQQVTRASQDTLRVYLAG